MKLKKLTIVALLVVMLVTLTGCANNLKEETEDLSGLPVYTEEEVSDYVTFTDVEGIEVKYPSNYVSVGTSEQPMFMDPDIAGASINIVSAEIPDSFSFEGYIDASIIGIKSEMTIDGEISKEYINLNGRKAAKLEYVAETEGVTMTAIQVIINKDGTGYILTLGALKDDIEEARPKFDKIIKSFK